MKNKKLCPHCAPKGKCQNDTEEKPTESQKEMEKALKEFDKVKHLFEDPKKPDSK
jgi:hypothetical protein